MEDDQERDRLRLSYAAENRRAEIALLWSRSLYFWGFIAVVVVAYGGALQTSHERLAFVAGCFGMLCSLCWSLANRSSKYWQRVWEIRTERFAEPIIGGDVFPRPPYGKVEERWFWGAKQYSPSKLATAVSDLTTLTWLALVLATFSWKDMVFDAIASLAAGAYAVIILIWCRSGDPLTLKQAASLIIDRFTMIVTVIEQRVNSIRR